MTRFRVDPILCYKLGFQGIKPDTPLWVQGVNKFKSWLCEVPSRPRPHRPLPEPGWYMSVQRELNCLSSSLWSVLGQVGLKLAHAGLNQAQVGHTKRFLLKISALVGILELRVLIVIDSSKIKVWCKFASLFQISH